MTRGVPARPCERVCIICGATFLALRPSAKVCKRLECWRRRGANQNAAWVRANPERNKRNATAWRLANPEKWQAAQDRYRLRVCPVCKTRTCNYAGPKVGARTCQKCAAERRRKQRFCIGCAEPLAFENRRKFCPNCAAPKDLTLAMIGAKVGLTRERIRQLQVQLIAQRGCSIAEARALLLNGVRPATAHPATCIVPGCERAYTAKGYCAPHYVQARYRAKHGPQLSKYALLAALRQIADLPANGQAQAIARSVLSPEEVAS